MLETDRLHLVPLTRRQLLKYLQNNGSLEIELAVPPACLEITPDLHDAFKRSILPNMDDRSESRFYFTLWTLLLKNDPHLVGDLCFKGLPNESGEIEIGYGTHTPYRGQGYMTEAVGGMVGWAFAQQGVKHMLAETEKTNPASIKILEKNGFRVFSETETTLWWRISKGAESRSILSGIL